MDIAPGPQVRSRGHAGLAVPMRQRAHWAVLQRVTPSSLTAACAGEPPVTAAHVQSVREGEKNIFGIRCKGFCQRK